MRLGLRAASATGLAVLALAALAPACGSTDEVVARIPCTSQMECATGSFCSKQTCDDPSGTCELRPPNCGNDPQPVCGCPSTTEGGATRSGPLYWNDCVRRMHGEPAAAGTGFGIGAEGGVCPSATCASTTSDECPHGSFCSLIRPQCRPPADPGTETGLCLVPPTECPPTLDLGGGMTFHIAPAIMCDAARTCTDWCTAVRSHNAFYFASKPTTCQ